MDKKKVEKFSNIMFGVIFISFAVFAYFVQEDMTIDVDKYGYALLTFGILALLNAAITGAILMAEKEKATKISPKMIKSGIVLTILFVLWRVLGDLF